MSKLKLAWVIAMFVLLSVTIFNCCMTIMYNNKTITTYSVGTGNGMKWDGEINMWSMGGPYTVKEV